MTNPYYELKTKSSYISQNIRINDSDPLVKYFNFKGKPIPIKEVINEEVLNKIHKVYPIKVAGILTLKPYTTYIWHRDDVRSVSLNLLLNAKNVNSHTLFSEDYDDNPFQATIKELKYKPDTFYLLNTQIVHTVINFDQQRFLFSIEFDETDKKIDFEEFKNFLEKSDL